MSDKVLHIIVLCATFWLINLANAQVAKCDFSYQYHWTTGYKTTNASYYKCDLSTRQTNYNEKLTKIDGRHETGQSDTDVKWIANYKDNKLKTFSSIFCQKFPNLAVVSINDVDLESIDEDSLSNCKNLNELFLHDNKIREIPENLLIQNRKLTYFWIYNNKLTTLPENIFSNQAMLEYLELYGNQINFLPSNIFDPLVKLEVLHLFNNRLQSLNPKWFVNLQNLRWLTLNGNQIVEIPSKCFENLRNLERMWIYDNRIETLKSNSFDGLQNLLILNLRNNEISDLPVGVFSQLKNLEDLQLNNNKLATIHSDSFGIHNQLSRVYLQDNKINEIDEKFIDNTAIETLDMRNNICSQLITGERIEIKPILKKCFENYQPRRQPQPQINQATTTSYIQKTTSLTHKQQPTISSNSPKPSTLSYSLKPTITSYIQKSTTSSYTQKATTSSYSPKITTTLYSKITAPSHQTCGKSSAGQGNIIGGSYISRGSYPWLAALVKPSGDFFCCGTLISNQKVLTAAHCLQDKQIQIATKPSEFLVLLGAHNLNISVEAGRIAYVVESVNVHPNWNILTVNYDYDIAVLVLENEVPFNKYIQPICMPNENIASINIGVVVGYGRSEDTTKIHENIPKMIEVPIHSNEDCFLKHHILATLSSRRTFCGGTGTGIGVCRGDSGSGLTVNFGSAYYLRGIVSSSLIDGPFGCDLNTFSVFTDVTKYIDWIDGISTSRFK